MDIVELSDDKMGIYGNTDGEWMCKWMKNWCIYPCIESETGIYGFKSANSNDEKSKGI